MNVIVFDTETVGAVSQELLNVGYKIVDLDMATANYTELCKRDYIVRKHYNNEMLMLNDMFVGAEKLALYQANVYRGGAILRNIEQIFSTMKSDIVRYAVEFGYAYNCQFDTDKFSKTADRYGIPNPLDGLPILDIWGFAYHHICVKDDYIAWCKSNSIFTETQRFIQTSVEGVTAFLTKNPTFKEEHTALSDVGWELEILCECLRRGCDITKPLARGQNIPSGKIFTKRLTINGKTIEVNYTKMSRKWDTAEDINFILETP